MQPWHKRFARRWRFEKRYDVINYFIRKRGLQRYLEVGTATGSCMEKIEAPYRVGVDPNPTGEPTDWTLHRVTSDAFFASNTEQFDIVLIDGLHHAEQVFRDFFNAANILSPNGVILFHDCNPQTEIAQRREVQLDEHGNWNGDTWKAMVYLRRICPNLFAPVMDFDQGVGVVIPNGTPLPAFSSELEQQAAAAFAELDWAGLDANRHNWLQLVKDKSELLQAMAQAGIPVQRQAA